MAKPGTSIWTSARFGMIWTPFRRLTRSRSRAKRRCCISQFASGDQQHGLCLRSRPKKIITGDKIAEWKAGLQVKKLAARADDAESYAVAAMEIASAAVDEAERATIEAVVARIDADAVQTPAAKKAV
jgi:hypothetical protein